MSLDISKKIEESYVSLFGKNSDIKIKAPGRINILGEHTDYNNGFVMPSAIDKAIYFSIGKREDSKICISALDLENYYEAEDINQLESKTKDWSNHLIGVILEIKKLGFTFDNGVNICFGGDIPNGAGLSSSAAVEAGISFGLNEIFGFNLDLLQLAKIAQATEHNYVGVKCGIMDMYASLFSRKNQVIRLDCESLTHDYIPADFEKHTFILVNSAVKHNLADTEYNVRRNQCQKGVEVLNKEFGKINTLRDANFEQLEQIKAEIDPITYNRCKYILDEKERVMLASEALKQHDFEKLGEIMNQTHEGLSKMYEVSCKELDFLASEALKIEGVLGSRMMGGGFGGCTLNLIKKEAEADFKEKITSAYQHKFGIIPEIYTANLSEGVHKIA
ncbi:galactokinase [Lacihabitans soyangensis]|uniref:Galactokinase n=1 Tax=Lacihabitans soyangensis TaxID=869394 RepID=A0AAE3GYI1_9BACT|nr:galactokinase [Lacihabitans soyangensis]